MSAVQSIDRALALLNEIALQPGRLVDLAQRVDLPTSTAARMLSSLESGAAVRRDTDGVYSIGAAILSMARASASMRSIETNVHPHLVDLAEELDEAACLALVSGRDTVTVDQVDSPKPVQAENWTGTRVPMHAGGAGIVVMATWTDAEVDDYLAGDLEACSALTVTDPVRIRSRVVEARTRAAMWTHGEYVDGLSSACAAIIDSSGRAVGALYTYGPSYRFPAPGDADRIEGIVLARARVISEGLGYRHGRAAAGAST